MSCEFHMFDDELTKFEAKATNDLFHEMLSRDIDKWANNNKANKQEEE